MEPILGSLSAIAGMGLAACGSGTAPSPGAASAPVAPVASPSASMAAASSTPAAVSSASPSAGSALVQRVASSASCLVDIPVAWSPEEMGSADLYAGPNGEQVDVRFYLAVPEAPGGLVCEGGVRAGGVRADRPAAAGHGGR